jgi:hypothetical protein
MEGETMSETNIDRVYHFYCEDREDSAAFGRWFFRPWDVDESFERWSKSFASEAEARAAAEVQLSRGGVDIEAAEAACPN